MSAPASWYRKTGKYLKSSPYEVWPLYAVLSAGVGGTAIFWLWKFTHTDSMRWRKSIERTYPTLEEPHGHASAGGRDHAKSIKQQNSGKETPAPSH